MSPLKRLLRPLHAGLSHPYVRAMATAGGAGIAMLSLYTLIAHEIINSGPSSGPSMYPTLPSQLTYNIYSRRRKHGKGIQVGDIVVFSSPIFPGGQSCKRVIGMPGDYVVRDPSYSLTVGGAPVAGLQDGEGKDAVREEPVMIQVPEGHVWVLGDNISYSRDSRFHGPVPMALIQGKTLYVREGWFNWTSFRRPQLQPAILSPQGSSGTLEGEAAREVGQSS